MYTKIIELILMTIFSFIVKYTKKNLVSNQGAHYELTYNVNYKGEVGTQYLGFREKNNFYCPVSDKGSENCH
jgi:uncharacterized protein (UPF0305 family)